MKEIRYAAVCIGIVCLSNTSSEFPSESNDNVVEWRTSYHNEDSVFVSNSPLVVCCPKCPDLCPSGEKLGHWEGMEKRLEFTNSPRDEHSDEWLRRFRRLIKDIRLDADLGFVGWAPFKNLLLEMDASDAMWGIRDVTITKLYSNSFSYNTVVRQNCSPCPMKRDSGSRGIHA